MANRSCSKIVVEAGICEVHSTKQDFNRANLVCSFDLVPSMFYQPQFT